MIDTLAEMFSFAFMVRAIVVGTLTALCAALLGVPLVLKRCSMIGDGLSHVAFGALALGLALNTTPLYVALPVVVAAAFVLLRLSERTGLSGDAAIAMISTTALAIGISAISMSEGLNTNAENYLFGSLLGMTDTDMFTAVALSLTVIVFFIACYHRLFAVVFDEAFAEAAGLRVGLIRTVLALMTAALIVTGMRLMGALLISSLLVFPAMSAMRVTNRFSTTIAVAAAVSVIAVWTGVYASYTVAVPTGAAIVLANAALFLLFCLIRRLRKA